MKLKMGTRGSSLALAQSGQVARAVEKLKPGLRVETVVIRTSGDKFSAAAPDQAWAPDGGAKGLFVKEIEEALTEGEIDFAVHSAKDLPAQLASGLAIAAYPEREDPRDVLIARGGQTLAALPKGARVATSSLRRQIQLKRARPDLVFLPMRGNVDTRLRKLEEGHCDAIVLAAAGLNRLGRKVACEILPVEVMVPAPAQGALALEVRLENSRAAGFVDALDHPATRRAVEWERAVLVAVQGGCSTPLGVLARPGADGLEARLFYSELDGSRAQVLTRSCGADAERDALVASWAAALRGR